ncbi:MAG: hypothetical protein AAGF12_23880, partial [Myxococcota bacterium]
DPACAVGESCMMGNCRCGANPPCTNGTTCCGGECRDTVRDVLHCGRCGNACPSGSECCGGTCRDTQNDRSNCGGCGRSCDERSDGCTSGQCSCGGGAECLIFPCLLGVCVV